MKIIYSLFLILISLNSWSQVKDQSLILIGQMPGRYFKEIDPHSYVFGFIEIKNQVIQKMGQLKPEDIDVFEKQNLPKQVLRLKRANSEVYDVMYPGLINLHNHTKQNNIPVWSEAQGQFANRFEWRDWPIYKYSVSGNMNPWIDFARVVECATYRWSELNAMVLGTTYLQGPSSCVDHFGILRVEDANSFISAKAAVQAPTDLVIPEDMRFVWSTLRPLIQTGKTYEQALAETIKKYCPAIAVTAENVNGSEMLKIFKDQAKLVSLCQKENLPEKFIRYVYWIHSTIAGRKSYILNSKIKPSAVIAHLAEGRRDDAYNQKEYEMVKLLGLDVPQMNFVHGVGIAKETFAELASKNIGLVWSPFSNLILYSQTLDVASAFQAGVRLSIGSDWVPTGTKSVLEEVKIARNYILKDLDKENLLQILSSNTNKIEKVDEELFKMMTENPAKMIGHSEIVKAEVTKKNPSGYAEAAVGILAEGAMASIIVTSLQDKNPYTNLIKFTTEKEINLVIANGNAVYGNKSYLDKLGFASQYETLPVDSDEYSKLTDNTESKGNTETTPEGKLSFVVNLVNSFSGKIFNKTDKCQFAEEKAYVIQNSINDDVDMKAFNEKTGINLDKVSDITKLLAINIMTQSRNKTDPKEGKPSFSLKYFPALYTCNDENHTKRMANFINPNGSDDLESNRKYRNDLIKKYNLGRGPKDLADKYQ